MKLTDHAWEARVRNSTDRVVLLALCREANTNVYCEPSHAEIAQFACCSTRSVQRSLDRLEDQGLIEKNRQRDEHGMFSTYVYRVLLP